jgi:dTDP-glucose pyrophosphorylase
MKNINDLLVKVNQTIDDAIKVLDKYGFGICLIIDKNNKLVGTITDGDIRRSLLKGHDMNSPVSICMGLNPVFAYSSVTDKDLLLLMSSKDVIQIPIVNKSQQVVSLKTLRQITNEIKSGKDNPVVLMAGGFGKRLQQLTKNTPKPLLDVGGAPILETILKQFIKAGFSNFFITVHYKANDIKEFFGSGEKWDVKIQYIYENEPLGTAGSLGLLPKNLDNLPIIVMNGDVLSAIPLEKLLDFHDEQNNQATVCVREYDFQVPFGVVSIEGSQIKQIQEKPVHSFFVSAGIYVIDPLIIKNIKPDISIDMPNFLSDLINSGAQLSAFPIHEYWMDIGREEDFYQAQSDIINLD